MDKDRWIKCTKDSFLICHENYNVIRIQIKFEWEKSLIKSYVLLSSS